MIKYLVLGLLLAAPAVQAGNYLPISAGNRWTYEGSSGESFEIVVLGAPIQHGSHFYYKMTGYATEPLFVRSEADRVYWLNEEEDREEILINFEPFSGGYYNTPISAPCDQDAQTQDRRVEYSGPGGVFPNALEIQYRVLDCADTGVENELYLENIGLARRTVQTIAGPREFHLTSANVGPVAFAAGPGVEFRVSIPSVISREKPGEAAETEAVLEFVIDRLDPIRLKYPTSQRYDIAVKDENGDVVYLWSSTALFAQVYSEEVVFGKRYVVPLSLPVPDGHYQIEAWLTTDSPDRKFAATAPLTITSEAAPVRGVQAFRARAPRR
jgi:hypothetical protein